MELPVLKEPSPPWYAAGLAFSCTQCGNCCTGGPGYVWISTEEVRRLADYLSLPAVEVIQRYCRRIGQRLALKERVRDGLHDCIFLEPVDDGQGGTRRICSVYSVRPLQCRTWPFWDGNLANPDAWNRAAQRCPGINRGPRFTREHVEAMRDAADWPA